MTAIIDAQDLARYMKRTIQADSDEANAANEIIDGLEADLEAYVKRPISLVTVTNEEIPEVHHPGKVFLRQTPVRDVTAVNYDGTVLTGYSVETWGLSNVALVFLPPASSLSGSVPRPTVSYTAGLPGDDPTTTFGKKARAVLLRAAARDFNQVIRQDLAGVSRANVEGTSLEFHGGVRAGAGGMTDAELAGFQRWKRRRVRR